MELTLNERMKNIIKGEFISNALNYLIILWMNAWYHWGGAKLNYSMLIDKGEQMWYAISKKERGRELKKGGEN